ncbi:MAG TPA: GyrI-like domain-containing protein [Prolixibacteraceae bacterium]|nr:GyrI-like domain-containing protein [Prolixibacteraceae bacterium]
MKKIMRLMYTSILLTGVLTTQNAHAMEKKNVEKQNVLMASLTASLATLTQDIGNVPNELMMVAEELGLEITGAQIWQYVGSDGQPDTRFRLDICLPVKEKKGDPGKFRFEVLPEFSCISEIHKGAWSNLGNTYQRLMGEMTRKSIFPTGTSREIYQNCDFDNPENCITEVQVEIR